jgi:hypothetical protein
MLEFLAHSGTASQQHFGVLLERPPTIERPCQYRLPRCVWVENGHIYSIVRAAEHAKS